LHGRPQIDRLPTSSIPARGWPIVRVKSGTSPQVPTLANSKPVPPATSELPVPATIRVPPAEAAAEALERLAPRHVHPEPGDIIIAKELHPGLVRAPSRWRYRLYVSPSHNTDGRVFSDFQHAASEGEQLAAHHRARLLYVEEDGTPTLLNDYRR
jgi:hypothetical protein